MTVRADPQHDVVDGKRPVLPERRQTPPTSIAGDPTGFGGTLTPAAVLQLQRSAGNRAVGRLLDRGPHARLAHVAVQRARNEIPPTTGIEEPPRRNAGELPEPGGLGASSRGLATVQRARTNIAPATQPFTFADLNAAWVTTQAQIGDIEPEETALGFINMVDINRWVGQAGTRVAALSNLNPGAAQYTWAQVQPRPDAMTTAFFNLIVTLGNLRKALNDSFTGLRDYRSKKKLESESSEAWKDQLKSAKSSGPPSGEGAEEEGAGESFIAGQYYKDRHGAVVLIDGDFVVFVEHYQLKHNSDLGVLSAGGPFKGKKGSQLPGGWDAHVSTYGPQVLAIARRHIEADKNVRGALAKERTGAMEAYITIIKEGRQWLIFYHGNP